jgi:HSP20 family protein
MSGLKLWKAPFEDKMWSGPFIDMVDHFFEIPTLAEKGYRRSNIATNNEDYRIQLAVPGLTKEDIKISVDDSVVIISYEKKETDDKTYYFTSSFKKEYSLPDDCNEENISSKMENGVLEIIVPRIKNKKSNERFIEIK